MRPNVVADVRSRLAALEAEAAARRPAEWVEFCAILGRCVREMDEMAGRTPPPWAARWARGAGLPPVPDRREFPGIAGVIRELDESLRGTLAGAVSGG
jgi:hypothetical protein